VEVCGTQSGNNETVCDDDDAVVTIDDVPSDPAVDKMAMSFAGCTADVNYQVQVMNNSEFDVMTIDANGLNDDKFGDITTVHAATELLDEVVSTTCGQPVGSGGAGALPYDIDPLMNYTCTFVGRITDPDCNFTHSNTVTANLTDDDEETYTRSDGASVSQTTTTGD
jgi:hypothetical protein